MLTLTLVALGVGGSTVLGGLIGYVFGGGGERLCRFFLAVSSGIMLSAAVVGLILPSLEGGRTIDFIISLCGILLGAVVVCSARPLLPFLHRILRTDRSGSADKVLIFLCAITLHNLPEGLAAGVGLGGGETAEGLTLALGIALQNIPEGMVLISPLLSSGVAPLRTLLTASFTGVVEILGAFLGYFFVGLSGALLPFALALAGGSMLFVICDEMIPECASGGGSSWAFVLLFGFCLMLGISFFL